MQQNNIFRVPGRGGVINASNISYYVILFYVIGIQRNDSLFFFIFPEDFYGIYGFKHC